MRTLAMNDLHRKARLLRLKAITWLRWLAFELEPAHSDDFKLVTRRYADAKRELDTALLRERERRMNRRAL